ncbi:MAG: hypothetical protein ACTHQ3_22015 [Motilibacteraceae bacterium]
MGAPLAVPGSGTSRNLHITSVLDVDGRVHSVALAGHLVQGSSPFEVHTARPANTGIVVGDLHHLLWKSVHTFAEQQRNQALPFQMLVPPDPAVVGSQVRAEMAEFREWSSLAAAEPLLNVQGGIVPSLECVVDGARGVGADLGDAHVVVVTIPGAPLPELDRVG